MKKSYSFIVNNVGKTVAIITGIVAVLVSFTEVGIGDFSVREFTSTAILLLIASHLIFFSMEDAGEKLGKDSETYKNSIKNYEDKKSRLHGDVIPKLRVFLNNYSIEELEFRRKNMLFSYGICEDEYKSFLENPKGKFKNKRKLKKIKRLKPIELSPHILLTKEKTECTSELHNPQNSKFLHLFLKLIPSTLCMLFTASIMLGTKSGMNGSDVIEALLKLSALPIFAMKGYLQGFTYVKTSLCDWQNAKANLLDAYLSRENELS